MLTGETGRKEGREEGKKGGREGGRKEGRKIRENSLSGKKKRKLSRSTLDQCAVLMKVRQGNWNVLDPKPPSEDASASQEQKK